MNKGKYILREQYKKKCVNKENNKTWIRKRCFTRKRHCLTCSISNLHKVHNLRFEATMTKIWPCWNWKSTKVDREPQWWIILKLLVSQYYFFWIEEPNNNSCRSITMVVFYYNLFFGLKNPTRIFAISLQWSSQQKEMFVCLWELGFCLVKKNFNTCSWC